MTHMINRSSLRTEDGLSYFQIPELAGLEWLRHAFLTRRGGVSHPPYDSLNISFSNGDREEHVLHNRSRVASTFLFSPDDLVLLNQVHQDRILVLRDPFRPLPPKLEYDALVTNVSNTFLGIRTADCLPILVVDPKRKVIAAVHSWRQGTSLHIAAKVLEVMHKEFGCSAHNLLVALGPGIGSCCYEIDEKVFIPEWEPFATPKGNGKWNVDLPRMNIHLMEEQKVPEEKIFRINLCTHCHHDLFFSYRREGKTGRQLSFIGMVESK
jgi:YfiH family protein